MRHRFTGNECFSPVHPERAGPVLSWGLSGPHSSHLCSVAQTKNLVGRCLQRGYLEL